LVKRNIQWKMDVFFLKPDPVNKAVALVNKNRLSCVVNLFWFRRDLRLNDNVALYAALKSGKVQPIFIHQPNLQRRVA